MKIKELTPKLELHIEKDGLSIVADGKVLSKGFTDVGVISNELLPLIYFNEKRFEYIDTESLELFEVKGVDWISGLHYTGSDLTYLGHNFRSNPLMQLNEPTIFTVSKEVSQSFLGKDGCSVEEKSKKQFDYESQKLIETRTYEITIQPEHSYNFFNSIKYLRIVGKGTLGKSLNLGSKNIKTDVGIYSPMQFSLSQANGAYGVIDIRSNTFLADVKYRKINIYPELILVDSDHIIHI